MTTTQSPALTSDRRRSRRPAEFERRGNNLVEANLHLVDHVVHQMAASYPQHVDRDELKNAGALGLVDAARKFDASSGVPFPRYAVIRIRGAVLDSVRARDWASRSVRRQERAQRAATASYAQEHGHQPTTEQLADAMGVTTERIDRTRRATEAAKLVWLDQPMRSAEGSRTVGDQVPESDLRLLPQESLEDKEVIGTLHAAIEMLPEAQRDVLRRTYFDGEILRDIAENYGVSEARISQIRTEAVASIRAYFAATMGTQSDPNPPHRGQKGRTSFIHRMQDQTTWRERLDAGPDVTIDLRD